MSAGLIKIDDRTAFKSIVTSEWRANSRFWLRGEMKHIADVKPKTVEEINRLLRVTGKKRPTIVDIGCGEGWLYRAIREASIDCDYIGLDINEAFISMLKDQYKSDEKAIFFVHDIEQEIPDNLLGKADLVVNAFNFFEVPDLESAISNCSSFMRKNGHLLVLTIDPVMQLLAISKNGKEFYSYLREYAKYKSKLGYRKNIVVGTKKTRHYYYGILYSIRDYIDRGAQSSLFIEHYSEVIRPEKPTPQIFQFLSFVKEPRS